MLKINRLIIYIWITIFLAGCASLGSDPSIDSGKTPEQRKRLASIYAQMGYGFLKRGQPQIALDKLKRGLALDPNNPNIHAVLGELYAGLKEYKLAVQHYNKALQLAPQNPEIRNAWGSFLCQQQKYAQAEVEFLAALSNPLYTKPWETQANAGICAIRANNPAKGEQYLRMALASNPKFPLALITLAKLQLSKNNYSEANTYLIRYEQVAGTSPQSLLLRCKAALGMGDRVTALRFRKALIDFFPNTPEAETAKRLITP